MPVKALQRYCKYVGLEPRYEDSDQVLHRLVVTKGFVLRHSSVSALWANHFSLKVVQDLHLGLPGTTTPGILGKRHVGFGDS